MRVNSTIGSYESAYNSAEKALRKVGKDSGNEVLEDLAEEADPKMKHDREVKCIMVHKVVDHCLEEYKEGEYDFPETVKMINDALKKIK